MCKPVNIFFYGPFKDFMQNVFFCSYLFVSLISFSDALIIPVLDYIHQYQNNWIQHVYRMPRIRFPRTILNYRPSGKRSLGHPMKRWTEN